MKLLLDTHIWIWSLLSPDKLTTNVREALESTANELWLSPISVWEALLLAERGRLVIEGQPLPWIERMLHAMPRREAPLTHEVAIASRRIARSHQDPADRFLVATAIVNDLVLVTADTRLLQAEELTVLANR